MSATAGTVEALTAGQEQRYEIVQMIERMTDTQIDKALEMIKAGVLDEGVNEKG